jgi:hypothetical protein
MPRAPERNFALELFGVPKYDSAATATKRHPGRAGPVQAPKRMARRRQSRRAVPQSARGKRDQDREANLILRSD